MFFAFSRDKIYFFVILLFFIMADSHRGWVKAATGVPRTKVGKKSTKIPRVKSPPNTDSIQCQSIWFSVSRTYLVFIFFWKLAKQRLIFFFCLLKLSSHLNSSKTCPISLSDARIFVGRKQNCFHLQAQKPLCGPSRPTPARQIRGSGHELPLWPRDCGQSRNQRGFTRSKGCSGTEKDWLVEE